MLNPLTFKEVLGSIKKDKLIVWLLYVIGIVSLFRLVHHWESGGEAVEAFHYPTFFACLLSFSAGLFIDIFQFLSRRYPNAWKPRPTKLLLTGIFVTWSFYSTIRAYGDVNELIHVDASFASFSVAIFTIFRLIADPIFALYLATAFLGWPLIPLFIVYVVPWEKMSVGLIETPIWERINRILNWANLIDVASIKISPQLTFFDINLNVLRAVAFISCVGSGAIMGTAYEPGKDSANKFWSEVILFADFNSSHRCKDIRKNSKVLFVPPNRVVEAIPMENHIEFVPKVCVYEP